MTRILLGVDDSPAGLAAAGAAMGLASAYSGTVVAMHVLAPMPLPGRRGAAGPGVASGPIDPSSIPVLAFAAELAGRTKVPIECHAPVGEPAQILLRFAAGWPADVIVLGRSTGHRVGQPYVGSIVQAVLEFAEVPVLVVPPPAGRR